MYIYKTFKNYENVFSSEVMEFVCDAGKNTACQQNTCLCDVELANQILAYLEDWDPFHSNNKGFSPADQCVQGNIFSVNTNHPGIY